MIVCERARDWESSAVIIIVKRTFTERRGFYKIASMDVQGGTFEMVGNGKRGTRRLKIT